MSPPRPSVLGLALVCSMAAHTAFSLPDDRTKAIHITSDQALRDEKRGLTVYRGNVELDQGSLHISADRITIYRIVEDGDKIIAEGQPATLQQQPDIDEELVRAQAEIIEYYKDEDRVRLKNGAHIQHGDSTVTGETIDYFIAEELVKASSDKTQENSRVEVVIPANTIQDSEGDSGKADGK